MHFSIYSWGAIQFSFSHFFLDRNLSLSTQTLFLSLKSLHPLQVRPNPSSNHLVRPLNPSFSCIHAFLDPGFGFFFFFFFFGVLRFLWNFWVGLCWFVVICSCIASSLHYNNVSCIIGLCAWLKLWMLLGSIGFLPMMLLIFACHMFMPFSSIRSFHLPFHPLLIPLFHFIFSSMMRRPRRTSLRTFRTVVFIRNAKSFCRISPILLYLKSFRLRDRSPSVGNTRDV